MTGRFGYAEQAALPGAVVEACCMLAALRVQPGDEPWTKWGISQVQVLNVNVKMTEPGEQIKARRAEAYALVDKDWSNATGKTLLGMSLDELIAQMDAMKHFIIHP